MTKPAVKTKIFRAPSQEDATKDAQVWIGDFSQHGPIYLRKFRAEPRGREWEVTLEYADGSTSARQSKPFEFELTQAEADDLRVPLGEGGHQSLHRRLLAELQDGNTVTFNDAELGELIRYMTQYGSGGFQGRLYRAFIRSLVKQLRLKDALL